MSATIPDSIRSRLGSLLRLLGSNVDGEALGAARALGRTLTGAGATLHDLAEVVEHPPVPMVIYRDRPNSSMGSSSASGSVEWPARKRVEVRSILKTGLDAGMLSAWEMEFATSIITTLGRSRGRLSERQAEVVERLVRKIKEACS